MRSWRTQRRRYFIECTKLNFLLYLWNVYRFIDLTNLFVKLVIFFTEEIIFEEIICEEIICKKNNLKNNNNKIIYVCHL